ncbi:MAG TPA: energy transducer TonB, partial [Candidatus Aminicenantes bacterium]|nr:energy transducer TonB [Candidatus Aminicenantes bacterium]
LRVLRGHPELNEAALMAVKQWVYEPYIVYGQPQPVVFTVTVCFSLDKDKDRGDKDVKSVPPSPAARILANKPPVRVAGTHRPKKIKDAVPIYPAKALKEKIAGVVVVEASTDIYGRVRALRVISGHPELDQAALDAVKQWVYEPYRIDGKPMPVVFTVTVCFSLNKDEKK